MNTTRLIDHPSKEATSQLQLEIEYPSEMMPSISAPNFYQSIDAKKFSSMKKLHFFLFLVLSAAGLWAQPGTLDATFNPGTGFNNFSVSVVAVQPDRKILASGDFTSFDGTSRTRIARLNADGTLDNTFNPGTGFNSQAYGMAVQPDGKIVVGGNFTSFNGTTRNRIARLNADGTLDNTFNIGTGFNGNVNTLLLQPDGKVIVGGFFLSFNGTTRNRIARLNANGSLDNTFNPGSGFNQNVYVVSLQADGKVLVGGLFTSYNGTGSNRFARLNADGTLVPVTK